MSNEEKGEGEQKEKRWLVDDDECFFSLTNRKTLQGQDGQLCLADGG